MKRISILFLLISFIGITVYSQFIERFDSISAQEKKLLEQEYNIVLDLIKMKNEKQLLKLLDNSSIDKKFHKELLNENIDWFSQTLNQKKKDSITITKYTGSYLDIKSSTYFVRYFLITVEVLGDMTFVYRLKDENLLYLDEIQFTDFEKMRKTTKPVSFPLN